MRNNNEFSRVYDSIEPRQAGALTLKELRCCVRRTTTECVELAARTELVAEAEIGDFYIHITIKQQILSLWTEIKQRHVTIALHLTSKQTTTCRTLTLHLTSSQTAHYWI